MRLTSHWAGTQLGKYLIIMSVPTAVPTVLWRKMRKKSLFSKTN